jgi:diguanylate cyclase (GGDEF)-like protein
LGAFLLMWLFLLGGEFVFSMSRPVASFVRPIAVAVLAGILTRLFFVVERRTPSFWLLVAATGCALIGAVVSTGRDVGYPFTARMAGTGVWFVASTILVAAALLHPSSAAALATREGDVSRFSAARLAVFVALTLLGPFAWVVAVVPSPFNPASPQDFGVPIIIAALISLLLILRLALINRLADHLREELAYRATHDPLTGLGNRAELINGLDAVVGRRGDHGDRAALLLLDLDGFKHVNDSFGHPVGDELLVEVGKRLAGLALPASTVVRLGGDEFAVLLSDIDEPGAIASAEVVRDHLSQPYATSRGQMAITASVGVCVTPRVEKSSSEVLRDADLALYSAKAAGKNRVRLYDRSLENSRRRR